MRNFQRTDQFYCTVVYFFLSVFHSSKIRAEENKLHFDNVSLQEDGMYQCVARNSIGMIVSSSWVHILSK